MKFLALLGMAQNAGHLAGGDYACRDAISHKRACLVLLADDAAQRTKRTFMAQALSMGVPVLEVASKADLGRATGKPDRAVIAVCDPGFAAGLKKAWPESGDYVRGDVNAKNTRL